MSEAWTLDLSAPRKLVLLKLADHASDDGVCWPAMNYIAAHCGMSRRMVMIHIHALCLAGLLSRVARYDERGGQKSNLYQLHLPSSPLSPPSPPSRSASDTDTPSSPSSSRGDEAARPAAVSHADTVADTPPPPSAEDEVAEYVRLAARYGRPDERPRSPAGLQRYLRRHGLTVAHREQMAAWAAREVAITEQARPPDDPSPSPPASDAVSCRDAEEYTPMEVAADRIRAIIASDGREYHPEALTRAGPTSG